MSQEVSQVSSAGTAHIGVVANKPLPAYQQPSANTTTNIRQKSITTDIVAIDTAKVAQSERLQRVDESITDRQNVATRVRQTDSALDTVSSHIQAMKVNLEKIVKNYPPFPIDSKERMEILRSFISLRKEIDSMTIPPPLLQPGAPLKSELWQENGLAGLLPQELAANAPDAQVRGAYNKLGGAVLTISEGKQELKQNVLAMR